MCTRLNSIQYSTVASVSAIIICIVFRFSRICEESALSSEDNLEIVIAFRLHPYKTIHYQLFEASDNFRCRPLLQQVHHLASHIYQRCKGELHHIKLFHRGCRSSTRWLSSGLAYSGGSMHFHPS